MKRELLLEEAAALVGGSYSGDKSAKISRVASLQEATSNDLSYFGGSEPTRELLATKAGIVILKEGLEFRGNAIYHASPVLALEKIIAKLYRPWKERTAFRGVHPTAVVHESVRLGKNVDIGPYAVIDAGVDIGDGTVIGAGCYLGPNVRIGRECLLYPHVVIREDVVLQERVVIQPGAVIGACGFGYVQDKEGRHLKLEQVGAVELGADVEIGALAAVDRARFGKTVVGAGSKIDNLCNIAHNVLLGENNLMVAQSGIAGSCKTGRSVFFGGQSGVADHVDLGDGVMIAAKAGVSKSLLKPGVYNGIPAMPVAEYNRMMVAVRRASRG